jgi:hypothetical protein
VAHHTFAYARPGVLRLLVACIVVAGFALMFARFAINAEPVYVRSVQIPAGLISFACWAAVVGCGFIGFAAIRHWTNRQGDPQAVELDEREAFIPDFSSSAGFLHVRYADILSIHEDINSANDRSLIVVARNGESHMQLSEFDNEAQYAEFMRLIKSYWKPPTA